MRTYINGCMHSYMNEDHIHAYRHMQTDTTADTHTHIHNHMHVNRARAEKTAQKTQLAKDRKHDVVPNTKGIADSVEPSCQNQSIDNLASSQSSDPNDAEDE